MATVEDRTNSAAPRYLPLSTTPGHLVRRIQQQHSLIWAAEFGGDITGPQYAILSAVGLRPASDQRTIGEAASLDKSSTADIVLRLTQRGWLTHERDPLDGRRKTLRLSALARAALPELTRKAGEVQHLLLQPLPETARRGFVEVLREVAYAGAPPDGSGPVGALAGGAPVLELASTPGHLIRRAQQVHTTLWNEEINGVFTPPQYAVMSALISDPGIDQRTVGDLASLDKSSMADIADRLLRKGWIDRQRDPADGRRWVLKATPEALQVIRQITPTVQRIQDLLTAPLTPARRDGFISGAQALAYGAGDG